MSNRHVKEAFVWGRGYFDMFSLEIFIETGTFINNKPTLFHEFTHYLQNMTTINGYVNIDKYIKIFLTAFSKLGSDENNPLLPLSRYSELQNVLQNKNLDTLRESRCLGMVFEDDEYKFHATELDDYSITMIDINDTYNNQLKKIPFIAIDEKNIPLNEIVIRENMAMVNSLIIEKEGDIISSEIINEIIGYQYKEYIVLFDFINNFLPGKNLLKLVYCISEMCLNLLPMGEFAYKIFYFIKENHEELRELDTDVILNKIKQAVNYDAVYLKLFEALEHFTNEINNLFDSFNFRENEFVKILKDFHAFLVKGIEYRSIQETFYENNITNEYIQKFVSVIGCPIIYFADSHRTEIFSEVPDYFISNFSYLHGALKIFVDLYYIENPKKCPFFDYNICTFIKNDNCKNNYLRNHNYDIYESCLLTNSLLCAGIKKRDS